MVGDVVNILTLEGPMRSIMEIVAPVSTGTFFQACKAAFNWETVAVSGHNVENLE